LTTAVLTVTLFSKDRGEGRSTKERSFWAVTSETSNAEFPLQDRVRRFRRGSRGGAGRCRGSVILKQNPFYSQNC
jgi:hypothetical protein